MTLNTIFSVRRLCIATYNKKRVSHLPLSGVIIGEWIIIFQYLYNCKPQIGYTSRITINLPNIPSNDISIQSNVTPIGSKGHCTRSFKVVYDFFEQDILQRPHPNQTFVS